MTIKRRSELARIVPLKTWRDFPPMNASLGTMLHNRTGSWRYLKPVYEDKTPSCQNACPAGNDIEGWIRLLQEGDNERAYWHLKREQPFPAVLGRVCFTFCEPRCNRSDLDEPVGIRELERFTGDQVPTSAPHPDLPAYNGKTLAVIGSGPAGMSAAYYARLLGFKVTIFEALPVLGGLLRVGIPAYRLPREIVAAEFSGLEGMGIELLPGRAIGKKVSIRELRESRDYVFLATGVHESMRLGLEGEDRSPAVMSGLSMLKRVAGGEEVELGRSVVVVGGGNTAIDAARTALRLGCDVSVIYRRSESEMPAHPEEVEEARQEGVRFRFLAAPERIELGGDGTIMKLVCSEMTLGPPDESGRRRPVKMEGASFEVTPDSILTSIGEAAAFDFLEGILTAEDGILHVKEGLLACSGEGGKAGIYAGGDLIDAPHTVVHAVASGKRAAVAMDCDRRGLDVSRVFSEITLGSGTAVSFSRYAGWRPVNPAPRNLSEVVDSDGIVYDYFQRAPRVPREITAPPSRKGSFDPHTRTFRREEALEEAARCIHCGRCTECDNCLIFCPDMSVLCRGEDRFGYTFDYDYCKGCGICYTECPRRAISMIAEEIPVPEEE